MRTHGFTQIKKKKLIVGGNNYIACRVFDTILSLIKNDYSFKH